MAAVTVQHHQLTKVHATAAEGPIGVTDVRVSAQAHDRVDMTIVIDRHVYRTDCRRTTACRVSQRSHARGDARLGAVGNFGYRTRRAVTDRSFGALGAEIGAGATHARLRDVESAVRAEAQAAWVVEARSHDLQVGRDGGATWPASARS